jgi:hypothetical protein
VVTVDPIYAGGYDNVKKVLAHTIRKARDYIGSLEHESKENHDYSRDDFAYPWLNSIFTSIMAEGYPVSKKPGYVWGVLHASFLASNLGFEAVSVIEFGVAGGNGLLALERVAEKASEVFGIRVEVFGFDSGQGLPKPRDHRDLPNLYAESAFRMDVQKLRESLRSAQLRLGLVEETVPEFISSKPAPIAFISFDLDYYSSTMDALGVLELNAGHVLPRVHCYFDDIMGFSFAEFNGERLAIREFNDAHESRKISPIFGLKYFLPRQHAHAQWTEQMYLAHILDHDAYGQYDGLVRSHFRGNTDLDRLPKDWLQ